MSIECLHCSESLKPEEVFSGAINARRGMWNSFKCPYCEKVVLFVVTEKQLEIGMIDGFPGPVFKTESEILVSNLESRWGENGLKIMMGTDEWDIPYK